jgi:hypothetical protein
MTLPVEQREPLTRPTGASHRPRLPSCYRRDGRRWPMGGLYTHLSSRLSEVDLLASRLAATEQESSRDVNGLTVRCFRRPVLCAATSSCGRTGVQGGCHLLGSGVRQPVPLRRLGGTAAALLPQPRRACPLLVVPVDTDRSAGRPCGQRMSDTGAASPSGVRIRAAQRPSAMAALARTRSPWCPAAGRVDRWADTPTSIVCARAGAPITPPSWILLPGVPPGLVPTGSLGLLE